MLYIIIYMYLVYENKIHSLMHLFIHSFIQNIPLLIELTLHTAYIKMNMH